MRCSFYFFYAFKSFICVSIFIPWSGAENETIIDVPYKKGSTWIWSWTRQWTDKTEADGRVFYQVCDVSSNSGEPNKWIRSNVFHVGDAKRIDVTVNYAVSKCSSVSLAFCKEYIRLGVHKTSIDYSINSVPEPQTKPEVYEIFGTTSPSNLTTGSHSRSFVNTETYSFLTTASTPNYYLAIQYQGGCFNLYSVNILYSVCPQINVSKALLQLPRTIAPPNDSIQVSGKCLQLSQPLMDNMTLYGYCQADGEWSSQLQNVSGECSCKDGYVKDLNGSKAVCKVLGPVLITAKILGDTTVFLNWTVPNGMITSYQVTYYPVSPETTDTKTRNTTTNNMTIDGLVSGKVYIFKVRASTKVGYGEASNITIIMTERKETNCKVPGPVLITAKRLDDTTVFLNWTIPKTNCVITSYQITYYPVGPETTPTQTINATTNNITIDGLVSGKEYIFKVRASTKVSYGEASNITIIMTERKEANYKDSENISNELMIGIVGGISALIAILCIVVIFIVWRCRRRKEERSSENDMIPMTSERLFIDPSNYSSPLEAMQSHTSEIESKNLQLKINIGEGEFADVYKGILITPNEREVVAVKILKPTSSTRTKKDFIREASIMGQFKHPNVIELKGVVTCSPASPMMIVTEFMENGSLDHFLTSREGLLTPLQQVGIARGIANGMAYLTGMNFIHRDLAARNILVTENMASKIADFGLSRELDVSEDNPESVYLTQGGKIPIRWTPPEAIKYRKYSSASDVWSFGILLWEIMAFGERPYWNWENEQVFTRVDEGYRLPAPKNCPKLIHDVMLDCWEKGTKARPKFPDIVQRLDLMIRSPDKMSDQEAKFDSGEAHTNLGQLTSVEEWLIELNMRQYTDKFTEAGLNELYQVALLDDRALKRIGITLVSHRHKIYKGICELRSKLDQELEIVA